MQRPSADEFAPYYATYVDAVPDGDIFEVLSAAPDALESLLIPVAENQEAFAYGPGKWNFREVLGHVIDTERLFAFRALHFARGEEAPLPGMDQNRWAVESNAGSRSLEDLVGEFRALRDANVRWLSAVDAASLGRSGVASDVRFTVRALVYILAGHELHHRAVLRDRYLSALLA